jgi:hypothetical protein
MVVEVVSGKSGPSYISRILLTLASRNQALTKNHESGMTTGAIVSFESKDDADNAAQSLDKPV